MSLPPRTRVRLRSQPERYGYTAPRESYRDARVRWELSADESDWIEIRSATPPGPAEDWVVVWWPGNQWVWELVVWLEIVPE